MMTQSLHTKDFLCFAKCTDKGCTPAIANPGCDYKEGTIDE